MRLSRIEIENFKGIGTKQIIDLKPITLLFGPNSAGKSTILQSLHYLREILERRNADPDQTIAGGLIDLGGFSSLVNDHDLSRIIRIKIDIDLRDQQGNEWLSLNLGGQLKNPIFQNLAVRYLVGENTEIKDFTVVQKIAVGFEIAWSDLLRSPYISRISIDMDGAPIANIESPPQPGRAQLTNFDFSHPLLREFVSPEDYINAEELVDDLTHPDSLFDIESDPLMSPVGREIWELSTATSAINVDNNLNDNKNIIYENSKNLQNRDFRMAINTKSGALPDLDKKLEIELIDINYDDIIANSPSKNRSINRPADSITKAIQIEHDRRAGLRSLLDELILGPLRIARDYLNSMTYLGPLREIPSRQYRPRLSPDESRWAQGLAAWDILYLDGSGKLLDEINFWLSSEDCLKTGYRLEKLSFKEIPVPSRLNQIFERGLNEDDMAELENLYASLSSRTQIALRDYSKGIIVSPKDVGVGISQMIPVIVGCLRNYSGLFAVEQPELHVHPAVQVGLGDVFIRAIQESGESLNSKKTILVETHSEHLMLRLLRRIREKSNNELPPGFHGLTPEELAVIYIDKNEEGVRFRALRIDHEGEFIDRWPKGFFEERTEELF